MMVSIHDMFTDFELKVAGLLILGLVYATYLYFDVVKMLKHSKDSKEKLDCCKKDK